MKYAKRIIAAIVIILFIFLFFTPYGWGTLLTIGLMADDSCSCKREVVPEDKFKELAGIDLPPYETSYYDDTHGGFNGDGHMSMKFTFSAPNGKKLAETLASADHWSPAPMNETVETLFSWGSYANGVKAPHIDSGHYFFYDKQTDTYEPRADLLTDSASYNFMIAAYDHDRLTMYYYQLDT